LLSSESRQAVVVLLAIEVIIETDIIETDIIQTDVCIASFFQYAEELCSSFV